MERLPLDFAFSDAGFCFQFVDAAMAHQARKLFTLYLRGQVGPRCDLFVVELVFGELVGNVAKHAPGPLEVRILWQERGARLEVLDEGPGYKLRVSLPQDELDESHRGLFIVATYAEDLRVERRDRKTITSVTLPVTRESRPEPSLHAKDDAYAVG